MNYLSEERINAFIDAALAEDVGAGDHTTLASIPHEAIGTAELLIKDNGILAGIELAGKIFSRVDPNLVCHILLKDGQTVSNGDKGLTVTGSARSILTAERLVLNCMQRMSGIATYTDYLNSLIKDTKAKLLDTRKTTPNFRMMEKWAVAIGGGVNHRFGLYDMILLKDNHIDYAGGIPQAVASTLTYLKEHNLDLKIEVETRTLKEVQDVLDVGGIHRIMLDNMGPATLSEAVQLIDGKYQTEASGGITEKNIRQIAETGVDFISAGALTHSYRSLDISLKAKINK
ncbi:carboxylating nicotinate-nucleotide diphosphorylase [Cytophagaceae bacterium ABcell3]|nr:carboxylating nicotinate-nucleotide diphosphorylase [Cytophagaceae bacterium ABcell3]